MMIHRHLDTSKWTKAAIDSALEYGDLSDWRELFARVREDRGLAREVLAVARAHRIAGSAEMAQHLVRALWPDVAKGEAGESPLQNGSC